MTRHTVIEMLRHSQKFPRGKAWIYILLLFLDLLFVLRPISASGQTNLPTLISARQVHQLTTQQAVLAYPVQVRGVITYVAEDAGHLFVQDETGGIFVEIHGHYGFGMNTGQVLAIEGVSAPGGFAPDIVPRRIRLEGEAPLPPPRKVTFEQMAGGEEDCNWVEFGGIVRSVRPEPVHWAGLEIVGGGGRVIVPIRNADLEQCQKLIDAEVLVRGVCTGQWNQKGQLIQVAIQAPSMAEIAVTKAAPPDPFAVPFRKISHLLQYAPREEHVHRVKVRGRVTAQQAGRSLFIADETQGLCIQTRQATFVDPGDIVEVVGFPAAGQYISPVLQDAVFRKLGRGQPVAPVKITAKTGHDDTNQAALVQLEAFVLNRMQRQQEQILQLKSQNIVFDARVEAAAGQREPLNSIPDGSRVLVTGICLVPADLHLLTPGLLAFSLLLRSPADVVLLQRPSWWTVQHTLWVLGATVAVSCASLAWVALLRSRVKAQTEIIRHRTQREAALEERTRIARDLHDELGSSLTQIALLSGRPEAHRTADLPGNLRKIAATAGEMAQSLDEIVWAVNPQHDTLEGLIEYLSQYADDFLQDTSIHSRLKVPAELPRRTLLAEIRHELFLAYKEALNNVVKHASATEIQIDMTVEPAQFQIRIADNGIGFEPAAVNASGSGLKNMRHRLAEVGGRFELCTKVGEGTAIRLTLPL
jgi:signal transduction histidine kinase